MVLDNKKYMYTSIVLKFWLFAFFTAFCWGLAGKLGDSVCAGVSLMTLSWFVVALAVSKWIGEEL